MNSAPGSCACAARSRSNATSCSASSRSPPIKSSASPASGQRQPEPPAPANQNHGKFLALTEFCKRLPRDAAISTDCVAAASNCSRCATILSWVCFFVAAKSSSAFFACTDNSASCSESGFTISTSFSLASTKSRGPTPGSRRAQSERQRDPGETVENQINPDEKADHPES